MRWQDLRLLHSEWEPNFSCIEIAAALNELARRNATLTVQDVAGAKSQDNLGSALKRLSCQKARCGLQKVKLSEILKYDVSSREPSNREPAYHQDLGVGQTPCRPHPFAHDTAALVTCGRREAGEPAGILVEYGGS